MGGVFCVSVWMGAQEMRQTRSRDCKKLPRAFPQTHNKTHDSVLSVFMPRHVEVGQRSNIRFNRRFNGGTCQPLKPQQLSVVFGGSR